jgi:hypothetical protein
MGHKGEWWPNECGGMVCSNCGTWHDDYYGENPPDVCPKCKSIMTINEDIYVHKELRISRKFDAYYIDESEYPEWLKLMRSNSK